MHNFFFFGFEAALFTAVALKAAKFSVYLAAQNANFGLMIHSSKRFCVLMLLKRIILSRLFLFLKSNLILLFRQVGFCCGQFTFVNFILCSSILYVFYIQHLVLDNSC